MRDLKINLTNSIKSLESDILSINKEQEKFTTRFKNFGESFRSQDAKLARSQVNSELNSIRKAMKA